MSDNNKPNEGRIKSQEPAKVTRPENNKPLQTDDGKAEKRTNDPKFDIFLANKVFPDPLAIFSARPRPIQEIKDSCLIILDTNALLVPYGISKDSLAQIEKTYKNLISSKRLKIPGQVAREFARNRAAKLGELYRNIDLKRNIQAPQQSKYPLLETLTEYRKIADIEADLDKSIKNYRDEVGRLLDRIQSWSWNDPVSLMYSSLFTSDTIHDLALDEDTKVKIKENLSWRQIHRIPPGYKDAAKEDEGIGDLLIWKTILALAEKDNRSVIFVSGEEKADWWHRSQSQTLYPRYELIEEFRQRTNGQSFHIIRLSQLLDLYEVKEEAVLEVKQEELLNQIAQVSNIENAGIGAKFTYYAAERAAYKWLQENYKGSSVSYASVGVDHGIDFEIVDIDQIKTAVDVKYFPQFSNGTVGHLSTRIAHLNNQKYDQFCLLLILDSVKMAQLATRVVSASKLMKKLIGKNVFIIIGYIDTAGKFTSISMLGRD